MKKYFGRLILVLILLAIPVMASTVRIYVSNQSSGTLDIIDPATNKIVQTIEGMSSPDGVVFSPDGSRAYIPDQDEQVLNVVNTKTGKSIAKVPLSGLPNLPAITRDGGRVLVSIFTSTDPAQKQSNPPMLGAVDIVNTTTLEKTKTIPLKGSAHDMFTTRDGKYAVVGSDEGHFALSAIDLQSEQLAWEVPFDASGLDSPAVSPSKNSGGVLTFAIESSPDGSARRIFAERLGSTKVFVIDFMKREVVDTIQLPPNTNRFRVGNPIHGTTISPDGKNLWVSSPGSSTVYVYSLADFKLQGQIAMPESNEPGQTVKSGDPHWLTFTPDGKTVYVAMAGIKAACAIDVKTMKVVAQIPVGKNPRHVTTFVMQ